MKRIILALALPATFGVLVSCAPADPVGASGSGGAKGTGSGGSSSNSGGAVGSGSGGSSMGSGGASSGSGGDVGTGSGGSSSNSGGSSGTGSGGSATGSGGRGGSGGGSATGGGGANGGSGGNGGRGGSGGTGSGGMGTGGAASGGAAPTPCPLTNHSGSGSFTHYYFGQGTGRDGSGYRTACGYYGTESGTTDTVTNVASMSPASATYFAAIPGNNGFDSKGQCGACVQITGQNGRMIIATIVDECPYGKDGGNTICGANAQGHLDLSNAAFDQLGYSVGDPKNTNWKYVPCPVTGNVVLQIKNGNDNEFFIQNTILAVKSVQREAEMAVHQSYGAWHFNSKLNIGDTLTVTDVANRTIQITVMSTAMGQNQNAGLQFPACQN